MAGLCPGTSCVAAAAGRVDGVAVMAGMFLGIIAFNNVFDRIATFYESTALGPVTLPDLAGISYGAGIAILTIVALMGFAVASRIEGSRS